MASISFREVCSPEKSRQGVVRIRKEIQNGVKPQCKQGLHACIENIIRFDDLMKN